MGSVAEGCCKKEKTKANDIPSEKYVPLCASLFKKSESKAMFLSQLKLVDFLEGCLKEIRNLKKGQSNKEEEKVDVGENDPNKEEEEEERTLHPKDIADLKYKGPYFNADFNEDDLEIIFQGTIGKHSQFLIDNSDKPKLNQLRKEFFLEYFSQIEESVKKYKSKEGLYFYYLIATGLVYCKAANIDKLDLFYQIFAEDDEKIKWTPEFEMFMHVLLLGPSSSYVNCIYQTKEDNKEYITDIPDKTLLEISRSFESEDVDRLIGLFRKVLFEDQNMVYKQEIYYRFKENKLVWIFDPEAIKYFLEETNISKEGKKDLKEEMNKSGKKTNASVGIEAIKKHFNELQKNPA